MQVITAGNIYNVSSHTSNRVNVIDVSDQRGNKVGGIVIDDGIEQAHITDKNGNIVEVNYFEVDAMTINELVQWVVLHEDS